MVGQRCYSGQGLNFSQLLLMRTSAKACDKTTNTYRRQSYWRDQGGSGMLRDCDGRFFTLVLSEAIQNN